MCVSECVHNQVKISTRNKTYALKGIAVYYNHHLNCCGSTNGLNVRYTENNFKYVTLTSPCAAHVWMRVSLCINKVSARVHVCMKYTVAVLMFYVDDDDNNNPFVGFGCLSISLAKLIGFQHIFKTGELKKGRNREPNAWMSLIRFESFIDRPLL